MKLIETIERTITFQVVSYQTKEDPKKVNFEITGEDYSSLERAIHKLEAVVSTRPERLWVIRALVYNRVAEEEKEKLNEGEQ